MAKLKLDGDASGAVKATEDVAKGVKKVAEAAKEAGKATEEAGKHHEKTFGSEAVHDLEHYVTGMVTVHKAIETTIELWHNAAEERKKYFENVSGGLPGAGAIANVSRTQEEFNKWTAVARDQLMGEGIFNRQQQSEAFNTASQLAAAGLSDKELKVMVELGKKKQVLGSEMGDFAESVRAVQERYGQSAGDFATVAKKLIFGSADTLGRVGVSDIGLQLAEVGDKAIEQGMTFDQTEAAYIVAARTSAQKRKARQRAIDYFSGDYEFSANQKEQLAAELAMVQGAPGREIPDFLAGDPRFGAARGAEESKAALDKQLEEQLATRHALYETVLSENATRSSDRSQVARLFETMLSRGLGYISEDTMIRRGAMLEEQYPGSYSKDTIERMANYLQEQTELMRRQDRNPSPPSGPAE